MISLLIISKQKLKFCMILYHPQNSPSLYCFKYLIINWFLIQVQISLNYKHMEANQSDLWRLITLLNSLFSRQSLRKNTYIFNSLNDRMEISIKTILKERRVAQITNDLQMVIQALKQCANVEVISSNFIKILMKGDEVIVRLSLPQGKKIAKKQVQSLSKQMKCELKENHDHFLIEFQSHAATVQFVERVKAANKDYLFEIIEKNPYKCIQESISNYRAEKKNTKQTNYYQSQQSYGNNYGNNYANSYGNYDVTQYYSEQYPIFIRRAIPSDDQYPDSENQKSIPKKYVQKPKIEQQRPRFNSQEFPTFEKLTVTSPEAKIE